MKKIGVAILGLGVVGGGTYKILTEKREYFKKTQNIDVTVESVLELNKERAKALGVPENIMASNIAEVVTNPNVDIVVEVIGGVKIAREFVLQALMSGKAVVTSNKELVAKYWHELESAAKVTNVGLFFEASCVGGVPIIRTLVDGMQANKITEIKGIVNGTTNYILTKMTSDGVGYEEVLKEAQALGYAEANPTADVDGFDSMYKISILSSIAFAKKVPIGNVYREGMTKITNEDIAYADKMGYVIKLLAIAKNGKNGIEARVHPTLVPKTSPLAFVNDSFNAVFMHGDSVDDVMLYGRGAGAAPTGSAIVSDVLFAATYSQEFRYAPFKNTETAEKSTRFATDFTSKYFIRVMTEKSAGALSKIVSLFNKYGVSVSSVVRNDLEDSAEIVVMTEVAKESSVNKVISKLGEVDVYKSLASMIRVED